MIGPLMEQPQYNMLARERVEKDYVLLYEHYGTGLTIFSPLKIGILTGKYNDGIPEDSRLATSKDNFTKMMNQRFGDENWKKEIEQVKKLKVNKSIVSRIPRFACGLTIFAADCGQSRMRSGCPRYGLGAEEPPCVECHYGGVQG